MNDVGKRVADPRAKSLTLRFLRSGVSYHDKLTETKEGTLQGGPLSPILANLILDLFDRKMTSRTLGKRIETIVTELRQHISGWQAYCRITQVPSMFKEFDSWVRRKLRCYLWKQWGRRGYRELLKRRVSRDFAWNTAKSAHGPWRLSRSPGLTFALTATYFTGMGLPRLYVKQV